MVCKEKAMSTGVSVLKRRLENTMFVGMVLVSVVGLAYIWLH
jgi:hypothetical protein